MLFALSQKHPDRSLTLVKVFPTREEAEYYVVQLVTSKIASEHKTDFAKGAFRTSFGSVTDEQLRKLVGTGSDEEFEKFFTVVDAEKRKIEEELLKLGIKEIREQYDISIIG